MPTALIQAFRNCTNLFERIRKAEAACARSYS